MTLEMRTLTNFVDARESRKRQVMVESFTPLPERLQQGRQLNLPKTPRRLGEVPYGAFEDGAHADPVSSGVMMEGNRDLNHPLEKLFVFRRCGAPDVLEGFVSVVEISLVEQGDAVQVLIGLHSSILA
jgi:hypothetical protein